MVLIIFFRVYGCIWFLRKHLQNRLPSKSLPNVTPFERWTGEKPHLSHVRIFGAPCYSFVHRYGVKAYRLYNPASGKFIFSRDVLFHEEVLPPHFVDTTYPNHVYQLQLSFYGQKKSTRQWNARSTKFMHRASFQHYVTFAFVYTSYGNDGLVVLALYVDDIPHTLTFESILGSIRYLVSCTRPNLRVAVGLLSHFMHNQEPLHHHYIKRLLHYIANTKSMRTVYQNDLNHNFFVYGFTDVDWASYLLTRFSIGGHVFIRRQGTVFASSCEAEYRATRDVAKEAI
ncbi:hypothetical protein KP509_22G025600 [Ceratopteris richardii]|uniref:Reverse transcriptase Ty1/copia-type domain-containing protein n=1 Tax=Ceratopteris richardii TaxID=49495 RepID=A0A8T2S3J2_CERRI|nr:hypothetical protein KP509_22G025600 [Ceratopteris richardii]